jgi:uroporphyrinogen-III synthase
MTAPDTVVVTRPRGQETGMMRAVEDAGFRAMHLPALRIEPLALEAQARNRLMDLDQYRAVIFASANAVRLGLEALEHYWPQWPTGVDWIGVGEATARALRAEGLPARVPDQGFNSEAVLALPGLQELTECKVLLLRGEGGRGLMEKTLSERGADVHAVPLYRRQCDDNTAWPDTEVLAVLVTSVESWQCLRQRAPLPLPDTAVIAGSERIAEAVRADGVARVAAAASPRDEDMLECLKTLLNR